LPAQRGVGGLGRTGQCFRSFGDIPGFTPDASRKVNLSRVRSRLMLDKTREEEELKINSNGQPVQGWRFILTRGQKALGRTRGASCYRGRTRLVCSGVPHVPRLGVSRRLANASMSHGANGRQRGSIEWELAWSPGDHHDSLAGHGFCGGSGSERGQDRTRSGKRCTFWLCPPTRKIRCAPLLISGRCATLMRVMLRQSPP
jgi:hypothetical protein